ncbi:MAG TPA: hypothetical protein VEH27_00870 [Methylomirabilota bacterium]|nr:hypothetical protein [Methylomirabilota bacterium]
MSTNTEEAPANSFIKTLAELRKGAVLNQLSETLAEVNRAVMEHRKGGEVIIKLKLTPSGEEMINVKASISTKLPVAESKDTAFFVDDDGNLSRNNPNQSEFNLKALESPTLNKEHKVKTA